MYMYMLNLDKYFIEWIWIFKKFIVDIFFKINLDLYFFNK